MHLQLQVILVPPSCDDDVTPSTLAGSLLSGALGLGGLNIDAYVQVRTIKIFFALNTFMISLPVCHLLVTTCLNGFDNHVRMHTPPTCPSSRSQKVLRWRSRRCAARCSAGAAASGLRHLRRRLRGHPAVGSNL